MKKCVRCEKYTLEKDKCPYCGELTHTPHPAKFSPDDKYSKIKGMMRHLKNEKNNNNGKEKN